MSSKETRSAHESSATPKFAKMTFFGKVVHVGKVIVFLASFGFAFPNIFSD